jgi:hypothetical protein
LTDDPNFRNGSKVSFDVPGSNRMVHPFSPVEGDFRSRR